LAPLFCSTAHGLDVVANAHAPLGRQWMRVIDDLHIVEQHIGHTKTVVDK
jgi:hypothetical protein